MSTTAAYCVYLLECCDGSYYCGITTDMERRLKQHNDDTASRYTCGRTPVTVLAHTAYSYSRSMALKLECRIKKSARNKKPGFIARLEHVHL